MAQYKLNVRDKSIVAHSQLLLEKLLAAAFTTPAEKISMAKALHVLKRMPLPSSAMDLRILLMAPDRTYNGSGEEHRITHAWQIAVREQTVEVQSTGYFWRPSTGSDSFCALYWRAEPGLQAGMEDFLYTLAMVDDAVPFEQEIQRIDLTELGYKLKVQDEGNALLDDRTWSGGKNEDEEVEENEGE